MALEYSQQIQDLLNQIIQQNQPGGTVEKAGLGNLLRQRQKALATAFQGQVSRGLSGTSIPSSNLGKFEEEVGVPARTTIESNRVSALTNALLQRADYLGREQATTQQQQLEKKIAAGSALGGAMGGTSTGGRGGGISTSATPIGAAGFTKVMGKAVYRGSTFGGFGMR